MIEVRVPKLNNNDAAYLLVEWAAKDGQAVRAGGPLAVLETSKAAEELTAEEDGTLLCLLEVGAECTPGQVIARLLADGEEPGAEPSSPPAAADPAEQEELVVTAPARRLMDERGISMERVRALGKKVIRRTDLESLDADGSGLIELSRAQRRVAEVVVRSHRDIPSVFTVMRIDVTDALVFARQETRRLRVLIGVPELLVAATGRLLDRFPLCFATPVDGHRARRAASADVGVTIDVGRGMSVPVVRDAGRRPLGEIARDLARFRQTALNGTFRESDLRGGTIMVTLHTDAAVVMAVPIVFPGQTCALSLTAPRPEVVETRDGGFTVRKMINLGLAYDHRYVNGRESAEFLGALRTALETPGDGLTP
ncbi:2-oxo acid dehydrogenase subunit E2 [Streptosporangium sp. NPDC087985]|uniref:2-oxo acid dehydrogenase subunit E2 n=1 Tax=Streptosporangium sp. NPDC087985 TaxID=3366196 RepID=UPI00380A1F44